MHLAGAQLHWSITASGDVLSSAYILSEMGPWSFKTNPVGHLVEYLLPHAHLGMSGVDLPPLICCLLLQLLLYLGWPLSDEHVELQSVGVK